MIPPTSIDGTDITGATIDGTDVTEITVDGQTVFSAVSLPTSTVAQYDVSQETGYSDNDTLSPLTDHVGSNDLGLGNSTYKSGIQNNLPVARFDGSSNHHSDDSFSVSQPYTLTAVAVSALQGSGDNESIFSRSDPNTDFFGLYWSGVWRLFAGTNLDGSTTASPLIISAVADGSNSVIRENGTQTGSGNAGNDDIASLSIGSLDKSSRFYDGDIGEALIYNDNLLNTGELAAEEQRLANKWGITI